MSVLKDSKVAQKFKSMNHNSNIKHASTMFKEMIMLSTEVWNFESKKIVSIIECN